VSLISTFDFPDYRNFLLYDAVKDEEKRAEVRLSGLLQVTSGGYLLVGVPTALVRGVFDAIHEPGICLPSAIDGEFLRAGIVVMTPEELEDVGGADEISERGKTFTYHLGGLEEAPAKGWPGVATCWHLRIKSPELSKLRRSYGLPTRIEGVSDFSIIVACRKVGVLATNGKSKVTSQPNGQKLPAWTIPVNALARRSKA